MLSVIRKPSSSPLLLSEPFLFSVPLLLSMLPVSSSFFSVLTSCSRRELQLVRVQSLEDSDHPPHHLTLLRCYATNLQIGAVNLPAIFGSFSQIGLLSILVSTAGFLGLNVVGSLFFFFSCFLL